MSDQEFIIALPNQVNSWVLTLIFGTTKSKFKKSTNYWIHSNFNITGVKNHTGRVPKGTKT